MKKYRRKGLIKKLGEALTGQPMFIQVIIGPRQVGKTTLALQVLDTWEGKSIYETADLPNTPTTEWINTQWEKARSLCIKKGPDVLLVLDEAQKIPRWSEMVKRLYDEDRRNETRLRVMLLGSSSLLVQRGLTESLAGRFEIHEHFQWSFAECREYFQLTPEEYIFFGGYPGALPFRSDEERWARYIRDSIIETVISKDVLLLNPITKPALLRQTFGMAMEHPAEIISYQKMMGQLQDAGNTTTIASYLKLLEGAYLLAPLSRFSGSRIQQRGSIPKLITLDNALITSTLNLRFKEAKKDGVFWGRLVENKVGAEIYRTIRRQGGTLYYWRHRDWEVDYVAKIGRRKIALEVKSGSGKPMRESLNILTQKYQGMETMLIAEKGIKNSPDVETCPLNTFLLNPNQILGSNRA